MLESGPRQTVSVTRDEGIKLYDDMQTLRRLETSAADLYRAQLVRGFCHLYAGQEACAVGMKAGMRPHDSAITAYRCHGWAYLMGISIHKILAELIGRKTGSGRGKGGSMHMYSPKFYGGNGIVGAQVPIGTGVAFAYKYRGEDGVCITCYGDGASNNGQVFETYNLAKLWELPVLFVCENNQFGMGTAAARSSANTKYYTRCEYIPGIWVDGMDVLAVREAARYGVAWCAAGKGPLILELNTYRYYGHSMADPGTNYRTREEVQEVRKTRDPIELFKQHLLAHQLATEEELKEIDAKIKKIVDAAAKQAMEDPEPGLDEIAGDLVINPIRKFVRGIGPWDAYEIKRLSQPFQQLP